MRSWMHALMTVRHALERGHPQAMCPEHGAIRKRLRIPMDLTAIPATLDRVRSGRGSASLTAWRWRSSVSWRWGLASGQPPTSRRQGKRARHPLRERRRRGGCTGWQAREGSSLRARRARISAPAMNGRGGFRSSWSGLRSSGLWPRWLREKRPNHRPPSENSWTTSPAGWPRGPLRAKTRRGRSRRPSRHRVLAPRTRNGDGLFAQLRKARPEGIGQGCPVC